jgi:hypothetical protein
MDNNPFFYAAIMTVWHVTFPSFLITSSVSGIVNVMFVVLTAVDCLLIFSSLRAIKIAQWTQ